LPASLFFDSARRATTTRWPSGDPTGKLRMNFGPINISGDETSHKFWEITLRGKCHSVRYGRIGAAGQEMARSFTESQQAQADAERLIRQKIAKGYQEKS
jgi:predicted DNA-binding WGR domain protein